jgi:nucleotidyltransferase AbiEii toxin of type IV toxin-antitoxin system
MIPEPQKTYVLELLKALGPAADDFVVAGAQAMKFIFERARGTKDIDFILNVVGLKTASVSVGANLKELGYTVVEGARNFQFEKPIPGTTENMRIEFMAPEEFKRDKDIRVDVEKGVHARACTGGSIAIAQSAPHELEGKLPDGSPFTASIRVTKPHALVMLKLLALDERYRNIRGPEEARHDREEARTHASDVVAIVSAQSDLKKFRTDFQQQFQADAVVGLRVLRILGSYFRETTSPGLLVYEESIFADKPLGRDARGGVDQELERAHTMMAALIPSKESLE